MKKQLLILSAFVIGMTAFGQKNEIKLAEKAIKVNNFESAISEITKAESLIENADEKTKAKFYYLKAKAVYKNGANKDVEKVANAFNQLLNFEKGIKIFKYSKEIGELVNMLIQNTASEASQTYEKAVETKADADYVAAAKGFHQVYLLSPKDTSFLDNAALLYNLGKDYNQSIQLYEKLLDINYTGITTLYLASNKTDGKEVSYADKKARDLQVKLGIAKNPREEKKESRRSFIYKNLSQSYGELGDNEKALEVLAQGREEFPNNYSLLIDEANIHYRIGDNDKFKQRLEEAIQLNPTEPTLYYNVGVMNMNQGKIDEAIYHFNKAIELKPDYSDAYNNIGAAIIDKTKPIIEEMNKSLSDFAKYDKLQVQQLEIYKEAVPFYEKAYEYSGDSNINVIQALLGLYENLDMMDKHAALKVVYDKIKE